MPGPDFLDTNVLVYAYDVSDPEKQRIAQELLRKAVAGEIVMSLPRCSPSSRRPCFTKSPLRLSTLT